MKDILGCVGFQGIRMMIREHAQGLLLKDKWALVTGASHGIGRALAEELARESAAVILTSDMLSQDGLDKVCTV